MDRLNLQMNRFSPERTLRLGKRSTGCPVARWIFNLKKVAGSGTAQNRNSWRSVGKTFVQQWTAISLYNVSEIITYRGLRF